MRLALLAMRCGLHNKIRPVQVALNEFATCLHSGYYFIKGKREWGDFYAQVALEMSGVRLTDAEIKNLANAFLCDLLWVFQKIQRGEFSAAQYQLHRSLSETNFRFMRELRLRRGMPLPSFGLARRIEKILSPDELVWVQVDARLARNELHKAAWKAFDGLQGIMGELIPAWKKPSGIDELLEPHRLRPE